MAPGRVERFSLLVQRARFVLKRRGARVAATQAARAAWNRVANHQQLVYELPRQRAVEFHAAAPDSARVERYTSIAELPRSVLADLEHELGEQLLAQLERTFRSGATLFVVLYQGRAASMLWARRGAPGKRWYLPLGNSDVVLYGWHTSHEYRGLNLIGLAMQSAIASCSATTDRYLADVKVWNKPSIRAMEKAGFRMVLKTKPLG
jgi:hypothetical protein